MVESEGTGLDDVEDETGFSIVSEDPPPQPTIITTKTGARARYPSTVTPLTVERRG